MSDKFFFKGKAPNKPNLNSHGFSTNRTVKSGSKESPINLTVASAERQAEVQAILDQHHLYANFNVDAELAEDISALDSLINTPKTIVLEKTPKRNDPCSCGSGKKYKKCCG